MGDESTGQTAKRFDSREGANVNQHPMLTVEYHMPGE
jgi:hypothetical protein